jgi:hypothetical protein
VQQDRQDQEQGGDDVDHDHDGVQHGRLRGRWGLSRSWER